MFFPVGDGINHVVPEYRKKGSFEWILEALVRFLRSKRNYAIAKQYLLPFLGQNSNLVLYRCKILQSENSEIAKQFMTIENYISSL